MPTAQMANKPHRKSLRDRICAIFGIRRKPRVLSLFTEDLPQGHMQWMEEPQYLSYVQSLDSHLQSASTPTTSKESKAPNHLGHNASTSTSNNLHESASGLSLDHWTSTAISPLELFYCATVAPYDVAHPKESQPLTKQRPSRASCNRRKEEPAFPVRNTRSDLDCASRFGASFDGLMLPVCNLQDGKQQKRQDVRFLESGESCVKKNTKQKTSDSKEKQHDVSHREATDSVESESHKDKVGLSAKKTVCQGNIDHKLREQDSDVSVRFCAGQLVLTLNKSCKNIIIRCKDTPQSQESLADGKNIVTINLGHTEEIKPPNKNKVAVNFPRNSIVACHTDTQEKISNHCPQCGSSFKSSMENKASRISNDKSISHSCNKKHDDDGNVGCLKTCKEVQTDFVDSQSTRTKPEELAPSKVFNVVENPIAVAHNIGILFQGDSFEKVDVGDQVMKACTTSGSVDRKDNGEISLSSSETDYHSQLEAVVDNSDTKDKKDVVNSNTDVLSEDLFAVITGGSESKVGIGQCCVRIPPEGASSDATIDESKLYFDCEWDIMNGEDVVASARNDSEVALGTDTLRDNKVEYETTQNDQVGDKDESRDDLNDKSSISFVDEGGMVDVFLLMKIQLRNSSSGIHEVANSRSKLRSTCRLQHHLKQLEVEVEECRHHLAHVNMCVGAVRQEVTSVRCALSSVCHSAAMCVSESSWLRNLEPSCYKKYLHTHTRSEAKNTRELVRNHIEALSDLEVLIYRKHLVLLQVLPGLQPDPLQHPKRSGISTHKVQKSKRKEQTENNQEQTNNVNIEIVSAAKETCSRSNETISGGSPGNISTLLSISSEGGASSLYLTDTEI